MKQILTVNEQFSSFWKFAAILCVITAILFFIFYLISTDPLWVGIHRLIAFITFIGAVFSFLRLREGQKKLTIELVNDQLMVTYMHKYKTVKEELFDRNTIGDIYKKNYKPIYGLGFFDQGYQYFISFTDTDSDLPMFLYSGRNLHFSKETASKIDRFVKKNISC